MPKFYINTATREFFNAKGELFADGFPQIAYKSDDVFYIQLCTESPDSETPGCDPETWAKDTTLNIPGISAFLSVDDDFQRRRKGVLLSGVPQGDVNVIETIFTNVNVWNIRTPGVIRVFNPEGEVKNFSYSGFEKNGETFRFLLANGSESSSVISSGATVDVPDSLYIQSAMDAEKSNTAEGLFAFHVVADSPKLREEIEYSDTSSLSSLAGMEFLPFVISETGVITEKQSYICRTVSITSTIAEADLHVAVPTYEKDTLVMTVSALLGSGMDVEYSVDTSQWHKEQTAEDRYFRFRLSETGSDEAWVVVKLVEGTPGKDGEDGTDGVDGTDGNNAPELQIQWSPDGFDFKDSPEGCYYIRWSTDNGETWSEPAKFAGKDAPNVMAQYAESDFGDYWHDDFNSGYDSFIRFSYDGGKTWTPAMRFIGIDGEPFKIDAVGSYDDMMTLYQTVPKGFSFLVVSGEEELGNVFFKTSNFQNTWGDPIAFVPKGISIQYSNDKVGWHDIPKDDDYFLRFSTDGGISWSSAAPFNGVSTYIYSAYASDEYGTDLSLVPSDNLPYINYIYSDEIIPDNKLTAELFADKGKGWAKWQGQDGKSTSWLAGETIPENTIGKDGDWYIDTKTGNIYLKDGVEWGWQMNIVGASGFGVTLRGVWDGTATYLTNEAVTYQGSVWIASRENTGIRPDADSSVWTLYISKGEQGNGAPEVKIQYSENGEDWVETLSNLPFTRFSADGGATYTPTLANKMQMAVEYSEDGELWIKELSEYHYIRFSADNGRTWTASQENERNIVIQYSSIGEEWDEDPTGNNYIRFSADGGATWSTALAWNGNDSSIIYGYSDDNYRWYTSLAALPYARFSNDNGKTWTESVNNTNNIVIEYSLKETYWVRELTDFRYFRFSSDNGETWTGALKCTAVDGYSPVRGKDYWTEEDIAEIKSYVDEAILNGEW